MMTAQHQAPTTEPAPQPHSSVSGKWNIHLAITDGLDPSDDLYWTESHLRELFGTPGRKQRGTRMAHVYCPDISNAQLPNPGYIERAAASYAYAYGVSVVVRLPRANHDYEATFSNRPQSVIRWDLACRRLSPRGVPLYDTVSSDRQLVILFYTTDYFAEEHLSDIGRNPKTLKIFERLVQNSSN